jgi:hypothetical protein
VITRKAFEMVCADAANEQSFAALRGGLERLPVLWSVQLAVNTMPYLPSLSSIPAMARFGPRTPQNPAHHSILAYS